MIVAGGVDRMTINLKLDLNEEQLRRIRAAHGRGGKATRNECRVWLNRTIAAGLIALPEPKVRGRKPGQEPQAVTRARAKAEERRAKAAAAPDEARCHHCRRPKADHGRMGYACPAPFRGTSFEEALTAVVADEYEPVDWEDAVLVARLPAGPPPALICGGPNLTLADALRLRKGGAQ
jgi:hypothetical protein